MPAAARARGGPAARAPAATRVLLPAVVVAIVVGILGMHVLTASHAMTGGHATRGPSPGAMSSHAPGSMVSEVSAASGETGLTLDDTNQAVPTAAAAPAPVVTGGAGGHGGMGSMMMLCSAMLLSAGAILLALFVWRRRPRLWACVSGRAAARSGRPALAATPAGPPSCWRYSVIRC